MVGCETVLQAAAGVQSPSINVIDCQVLPASKGSTASDRQRMLRFSQRQATAWGEAATQQGLRSMLSAASVRHMRNATRVRIMMVLRSRS
jgi:hypothetical protein